MKELLKNMQKVVVANTVKNEDELRSDAVDMSFTTTDDVKVGDLYIVKHNNHLKIVKIKKVISALQYSDSRYGLGCIDTMSWLKQKVDLTAANNAKKARAIARDIDAALAERVAAIKAKEELADAVAKVNKDEGAVLKQMAAVRDAILADPNKVDELVGDVANI